MKESSKHTSGDSLISFEGGQDKDLGTASRADVTNLSQIKSATQTMFFFMLSFE